MLETVIWVLTWVTTGGQLYLKADDNKKKSSLFSSYGRSKYQLASFFACSRPTAKRAQSSSGLFCMLTPLIFSQGANGYHRRLVLSTTEDFPAVNRARRPSWIPAVRSSTKACAPF